MTKLLEQAMDAVRQMPPADQDAIAQAILSLLSPGEADEIDPDHLQDVIEGLAEIDRGEVATDEEVEAAFRSFDR